MSDLTDYLEGQIMDWSFLNTAFDSSPGTLYIALHTDDPTESGDANEVSAADYSRADVPAGTGEFTKDTSGTGTSISNDGEISFGTATNDWGTVSHFSIWTDQQGGSGNPLWYSSLSTSKTVNTDDEIRFQAGDLTAQIN